MKTQGSHAIYSNRILGGLTISLSKSLNDANINVNAIIYENVEGVGTHVADATRQLASNSSSFMTGQIIRL